MTVLRLGIVWFTLLAVVSAQLQCHEGVTRTYQYHNEIKLWGEVQQRFEVSSTVEIDCDGESKLSTQDKPAFEFVAHFSDLVATQKAIQPEDTVKLCKPAQGTNSTCGTRTANDGGNSDEGDVKVVRVDHLFTYPVRFTQTTDGTIIRVQFMEKDLENVDVLNMKKGIISTLQTHINKDSKEEVEDETDSNGRHKTHYSLDVSGDDTFITKEYDSEEDVDVKKNLGKLHVKEQSTVQNGEITVINGIASSQPTTTEDDPDEDDGPPDVATNIEIGDLLKSESKYKLNLRNRRKRSSERKKRLASYETTKFIDTPMTMITKQRNEDELLDRLEQLYAQVEQTSIYMIIDKYLQSKDDAYLQKLEAIIALETNIGYGKVMVKLRRTEPPLVDTLVPLTFSLIPGCHVNWDTCVPLLSLFALGGGNQAEQVFQYMLSTDSHLTPEQSLDMVDLSSTMANPSDEYIRVIISLHETVSTDPQLTRSLLLVLGSLAGKISVSDNMKYIVRSIILTQLTDITEGNCTEDEKYVDALEAAGNMADEELLGILVQIGSTCDNSRILQIGVLHAVRGLLNNPSTVNLLITILESGDCELSEEVLNVLIDAMADMRTEDTLVEWPLVGLNDFDHAMEYMLTQTGNLDCIRNTAIKYFRKKIQTDTGDILTMLTTTDQHHQTIGTDRLRKRSVQHATCSWWDAYGSRYTSIQSSYAFRSDRNNYNRRKHCLAHFRVGGSKASANIYGGFFAGCNTGHSRAKIFGKIVAKGQVFGFQYTIGTVHAYLTNSGSQISGLVYVRVGGTTYINQRFQTPSVIYHRKFGRSFSINLPKIPVYITSITVVLRLSADVKFDLKLVSCYGTSTCLQAIPGVTVRASAGAFVSLGSVRVGADIGLNFNYHLKGELRLKSACNWPCMSLSHGHDRNTISIEFWYQLRKVEITSWPYRVKITWGRRTIFAPSSLKWAIGRSSDRTIVSNC